MSETYDLIVIGGGATGAGVARDAAMRGLKTILFERGDLLSGTTGKLHGGIASGGRYCVIDPIFARNQIQEHAILKRTAPHCIRLTGGMFVAITDQDMEFRTRYLKALREVGTPHRELDRVEALRREPNLNPHHKAAIEVPTDELKIFNLVYAVARTAEHHGAVIRTYTEVVGFLRQGTEVHGVKVRDSLSGAVKDVYGQIVINAAGPWCGEVAALAGVQLPIRPTPGLLLVFGRRVVNGLINHMRLTGDGDVLIPDESSTIAGTTSWPVDDPDRYAIPIDQIDLIREEAAAMVPILRNVRIARVFAGVRPLLAEGESERKITRMFKCIDHAQRDGLEGFISLLGGNASMHRLMAEAAVDMACAKLGEAVPCPTRSEPLVGAEHAVSAGEIPAERKMEALAVWRWKRRLGSLHAEAVASHRVGDILCHCEMVSREEVETAITDSQATNLNDVRRRTRLGMGLCQGGFCAHLAAGVMMERQNSTPLETHNDLMNFLWMRWGGVKPVLWGDQLKQQLVVEACYSGTGNYDQLRFLHPAQPGPRFATEGEGVSYAEGS